MAHVCDNGLHPAADGEHVRELTLVVTGSNRDDEPDHTVELCGPCRVALRDRDWDTLTRLRKGNGKVQTRKATATKKPGRPRKAPGMNTEAAKAAMEAPAPATTESRPLPPPDF